MLKIQNMLNTHIILVVLLAQVKLYLLGKEQLNLLDKIQMVLMLQMDTNGI